MWTKRFISNPTKSPLYIPVYIVTDSGLEELFEVEDVGVNEEPKKSFAYEWPDTAKSPCAAVSSAFFKSIEKKRQELPRHEILEQD